jgi:hypothetical protein
MKPYVICHMMSSDVLQLRRNHRRLVHFMLGAV